MRSKRPSSGDADACTPFSLVKGSRVNPSSSHLEARARSATRTRTRAQHARSNAQRKRKTRMQGSTRKRAKSHRDRDENGVRQREVEGLAAMNPPEPTRPRRHPVALPVEKSPADAPWCGLGRVGRAQHLAAEVGPFEQERVEPHRVPSPQGYTVTWHYTEARSLSEHSRIARKRLLPRWLVRGRRLWRFSTCLRV